MFFRTPCALYVWNVFKIIVKFKKKLFKDTQFTEYQTLFYEYLTVHKYMGVRVPVHICCTSGDV